MVHVIHFLKHILLPLSFSLGCKMASRYTQKYFFQHTFVNVLFRNLNEIIHPNEENIPEYVYPSLRLCYICQ